MEQSEEDTGGECVAALTNVVIETTEREGIEKWRGDRSTWLPILS